MLKRKFWKEKPLTLFNYLIKVNPLIKDSQTAQEVLDTLFEYSSFLKEVIREDGTKICLFYVRDESCIDELVLFEIYIGEDGNDYHYENYGNWEALQNTVDNFE